MRAPLIRLFEDELVVDNFAGGGGASTGIEWAIGRSPDVAINHNAEALAMHRANHPGTIHLCEDVRDVVPDVVCRGRRVALAWFSPDCTHFSKAKGGKPDRDPERAKNSRALAHVVVTWARSSVKPRLIFLENVEEFQSWEEWEAWTSALRACGYALEWRELKASKLKAPTSRKRLIVIGRCDGLPIRWPDSAVLDALAEAHAAHYARSTAADCIDFSLPMPSIFLSPAEARAWGKAHGIPTPKRPLAAATMRRVGRGVHRFVLNAADPFLINVRHTGYARDVRIYSTAEPMRTLPASDREIALVAPTLINTRNGERRGQLPRVMDIRAPFNTVTAHGSQGAVVAAFLAKHNGGHEATGQRLEAPADTITTIDQKALVTGHLLKLYGTCLDGASVDESMPTITAGGNHIAAVSAFLVKYYGQEKDGRSVRLPLDTIVTRDRFALVTVPVAGETFVMVDIGMRMLTPRELYRAQGFPDHYEIDRGVHPITGDLVKFTKKVQTRLVGNSVVPHMAAAVIAANLGDEARPA